MNYVSPQLEAAAASNRSGHPAIINLRSNQRQLDADGVEVGVSRQALDETLAVFDDLLEALRKIEGGFCPGSLFDATENATSQAEAQRIFHMGFSEWMQTTARDAIAKATSP